MLATAEYAKPQLTTRWLLDPTRRCNLRCRMCYFLHGDLESVKPWEQQRAEVFTALERGCDSVEISGGDPLDNPFVVDLVKLCVEHGLSVRIISSLICSAKIVGEVMDAGLDDWLVSMHGAKDETHNAIVHNPDKGPVEKSKYRQIQVKRLQLIMERMRWGANYVLLHSNQTEMADWARWLLTLPRPPHICNFISWNPHYEWSRGQHRQEAIDLVPDARVFSPILDEAIDILEDAGVGVNVRYLGMCLVAERHRKNICNDSHVWADQGEWLNGISGNTVADGEAYGRRLSLGNELQTEPCASCGLKPMCGGANKIWHALSLEKFGREVLIPQPAPEFVSEPAYWHYRRENVAGNDPRR